jgi:hypothetical protein
MTQSGVVTRYGLRNLGFVVRFTAGPRYLSLLRSLKENNFT